MPQPNYSKLSRVVQVLKGGEREKVTILCDVITVL